MRLIMTIIYSQTSGLIKDKRNISLGGRSPNETSSWWWCRNEAGMMQEYVIQAAAIRAGRHTKIAARKRWMGTNCGSVVSFFLVYVNLCMYQRRVSSVCNICAYLAAQSVMFLRTTPWRGASNMQRTRFLLLSNFFIARSLAPRCRQAESIQYRYARYVTCRARRESSLSSAHK